MLSFVERVAYVVGVETEREMIDGGYGCGGSRFERGLE